jgi:hypothetical protein
MFIILGISLITRRSSEGMKGLLLKESLSDMQILDLVHVIRTESWQVSNAAANQPKVWTAIYFETEDSQDDAVATALSQALKLQGWYINASTGSYVYVIYPDKVFKYLKGDTIQREAAKIHGRSIGVPEDQLDWGE